MTTDIKAIAKKTDPFASFALIIAAVTLIFAGTTTIIGNNVRDSIIDCNTRFGQELIDSLNPRSIAQKRVDEANAKYDKVSNRLDVVTLDALSGKFSNPVALRKLKHAYARKADVYKEVQSARANLAAERRANPYPTPPGKACANSPTKK